MFLPIELVVTQQELSGSELGVVTVAGISVLACTVGLDSWPARESRAKLSYFILPHPVT